MSDEPTNGNGLSEGAQAEIRAATSEVDHAALQLRALQDVLLDRFRFANQVGVTFGGKRNLYSILGYEQQITSRQYRERYARGGIAKRIIEAYPKATWRGGVEVYEDEDPDAITEFEQAFKDLDERLHVWSALERADILAGLSTYSVILLGAPGEIDTPMKKGTPDELLYLQPYFGGGGPGGYSWRSVAADVDATIAELDSDPRSPRFGEPLFYSLKRTNVNLPMEARKVHWSRVVHVAEGCLDDNVFGVPTLENVWNLLDDLDKVTGGGSEAFWLRANQGLHVNLDKDMALAAGDNTLEKLRDDLDNYMHGLSRMIRTRGVDVNTLGSDVANFGPSADAILKQIAGSKGIPLRILTGSEMGELASSQDAENWNSQVQDRRTSYAGPMMVRRLIDRLIEYGFLPEPSEYTVGWPVEEEMTEPQKADLAVKLAQANATMGEPLFTEAEIREKTYDMKPLTDEQRSEIDERALAKQQAAMEQAASMAKNNPEPAGPQPVAKPALVKAASAWEPQPGDEELVRVLAEALEAGNAEVVEQIIGLSHSYGTTQVQLPDDVAQKLFALGRSIPDEDIYEPEGGRETDAHVTVKYGLLESDVKKLGRIVGRRGPITFTLGKTGIFVQPEYEVVYVAVNGGNLASLNSAIALGMRCKESDYVGYIPHATVAYVQPGMGHKYSGLDALDGIKVTVDSIVMSDADGNRTKVRLA